MVSLKTFGATLWRYSNLIIIVLTPIVLLPLPLIVPGKASQCGFVMLLMAIYWCTEAMPLAVTGMIPIFLMPLLGLIKSDDVVILYMKESSMMFMGGLMVALAFQRCGLHRRVALSVLSVMGVKPVWLMFGFIASTWFLSMWICNAATTLMMLTILEAVLLKINETIKCKKGNKIKKESDEEVTCVKAFAVGHNLPDNNIHVVGDADDSVVAEIDGTSIDFVKTGKTDNDETESDEDGQSDEEFIRFSKGMTLATVYAANIGGSATMTGAAPNVVMKNFAEKLWKQRLCTASPVNFPSWMLFSTPPALITAFFIWIWLALFYLRPKAFRNCLKRQKTHSKEDSIIKAELKRERKELGKISYTEWLVLFVLVMMILLWFFRSPGFMRGWADVIRPHYINDSMVSMMCTVALFIIPKHPFRWGSQKQHGKVETLLDWQTIHDKYPWGIIFLIGGGFALSEACLVSGLSDVIGKALTVFEELPGWLLVSVIILIISLLTELTTNPAACALVMPIVADMAEKINVNPLYLMYPSVLATSYTFLFPVATPPNAVAFGFGRITVLDMVKAGLVLKLTAFFLVLATETWGMAYFHLDTPVWNTNNTSPCIML